MRRHPASALHRRLAALIYFGSAFMAAYAGAELSRPEALSEASGHAGAGNSHGSTGPSSPYGSTKDTMQSVGKDKCLVDSSTGDLVQGPDGGLMCVSASARSDEFNSSRGVFGIVGLVNDMADRERWRRRQIED